MNLFVRRSLAAGTGLMFAMLAGGTMVWAQSPAPSSTPAQTPAAARETASAPSGSAADAGSTQSQKTIQLVPAQALLDHTIDAKKAQQGQPVTAKLAQDVQIPNQQALPKNTVLEGHVDQVQASEHKSDSLVTVTFDKAKLKDGQELAIKATVLAVAEPALMAQEQAASGAAPSAGGAPMAGGGSAPQSSGGGGGSRGSGATTSSGPASGGPAGGSMDAPESSTNSQQQAQKNGVPDVTLKSDIHDHTSATFTSKGRNVHVPDGTQMAMAIAIIPPGVKIQ